MDEIDPRLFEVFLDVQRGLPRQGPGDNESTRRALALCSGLPERPGILDIGCGPGMQTIALAEASGGNVLAVDTCDEYLEELRRRLEELSLSGRVEVRNADMSKLGLPERAFDLIWCEGAAYIMGVREALVSWRPLLRVGGYLGFTELVWLDESPPREAVEFFGSEYPAMTNVEGIKAVICETAYELVADFTLPDSSWWDDYYGPLERKLPSVRQKYEGDAEALGIVSMSEAELDVRRRFGGAYGYQFFVTRTLR